MVVLLDIRWKKNRDYTENITQINALRVNDSWITISSFDERIVDTNSPEMAQEDRERKSFQNLEKWLRRDDVIYVWNDQKKRVFHGKRDKYFAAPYQQQAHMIVDKVGKEYLSLFAQNHDFGNIKNAINILGVPISPPANDAENMRKICCLLDLSVTKRIDNSYAYLPKSKVFHVNGCPRIFNASKARSCNSYEEASQNRAPCKICNPLPHKREAGLEAKFCPPSSSYDPDAIVSVRLLGGKAFKMRNDKVIGMCHNLIHPGKLTKEILQEHDCIAKNCPFLDKYMYTPFWISFEKERMLKEKKREYKRRKKEFEQAENEKLVTVRQAFQRYAASTKSKIDIVRVEFLDEYWFRVFFVSDNRFADGNRYPDFINKVKEKYGPCGVFLRHVRDANGYFLTREEYRNKK